jgi:hypothetical protein
MSEKRRMATPSLIGLALTAGSAIVGAILTPALAGADPAIGSHLNLSVTATDPAAPHTVVLDCDPVGGTHPAAADACADLSTANGHFDAIHEQQAHPCPMIYQPVTAKATGTWRGQPIDFSQTYPNRCTLGSETGSVFTF